jgi:2-polyprenyl-3-methyl-5-hydroxy-6-metoxy-1,4-benzoquinol methylase
VRRRESGNNDVTDHSSWWARASSKVGDDRSHLHPTATVQVTLQLHGRRFLSIISPMIRNRASLTDDQPARSAREAEAFDGGRIVEKNLRWKERFPHVMHGPNSQFGEQRYRELLRERVVGGRVMEIGCGSGGLSAELHKMGARTVFAIDVSRRHIDEARATYGDLSGVSFNLQGAEVSIRGRFDVITGHSILHHLDFRTILVRLFEENLLPGGRMVFVEPMSHPLTLGFHWLFRSAHSPDEWPITPTDVIWLRETLGARVMPINLLSFPVGVISSFTLTAEDNWLMRLVDRADRSLARRYRLVARGREGLVVIDRPATQRPRQSTAFTSGVRF